MPSIVTEYLANQTGPFTSLSGLIAFEKLPQSSRISFTHAVNSSLDTLPDDSPEVEYLATSSADAVSNKPLGIIEGALTAPLSRGNITISSGSALDSPVIDIGWFADPAGADISVAVAAIRRILEAWRNITDIVADPEAAPGVGVLSDEAIEKYVRVSCSTLYHAGGTCAMGLDSSKGAVVDSKARVFGVEALRVVDNSAIPFMMPGHPQANVYMFAGKIADDIVRSMGQFSG